MYIFLQEEIERTKSGSVPKPIIKVIDANTYLDVDRRSLKQDSQLVDDIAEFDPHVFSFISCFSYVSMLKTHLEAKGIFSKLRLKRNLVTATNGRLITLDDQQNDILFKIAEPDNIKNKSVVIKGPEGSGKTLLGLEVAKMMINYHFNNGNKGNIRVIVSACYKSEKEVGLLMEQFQKELFKKEHWKKLCDIYYEPIEAKVVQNPNNYFYSGNHIEAIIRKAQAKQKTKEYVKNIIVIDELDPEFETTDWKVYQPNKGFQIIFCLKYTFDDQKIKNKRETNENVLPDNAMSAGSGSDITENFSEGVTSYDHVIVGQLQKGHRCSNQIRQLAYYLLIHAPEHERRYQLKNFNQGLHYESFDAKYCPFWIEMKNVHSFVAAAQHENLHCGDSDVVLIFDPEVNQDDLKKLKTLCQKMKWKCYAEGHIVGSEASTVIIYDLVELNFEAFTRAINNLIFITTSSTEYVFFMDSKWI